MLYRAHIRCCGACVCWRNIFAVASALRMVSCCCLCPADGVLLLPLPCGWCLAVASALRMVSCCCLCPTDGVLLLPLPYGWCLAVASALRMVSCFALLVPRFVLSFFLIHPPPTTHHPLAGCWLLFACPLVQVDHMFAEFRKVMLSDSGTENTRATCLHLLEVRICV